MFHTRLSRLSIFAIAAGTCLALAPRVTADGHGAPAAEPAGHGDAHGSGDGAKPAYQPVPVAKSVSLKAPPAAAAASKPAANSEPRAPLSPIKPVSSIKPVGKTPPGGNAQGAAGDEALADTPKTAEEALTLLREGNQRWLDGSVQNPSVSAVRRKATADLGQRPFAVVLTCADSRIPVERVFDRGVGEVFVARVAGNIAGQHESGTIEYALEHLGAPVLVVMGHSKCGAVKATVDGGQATSNIASLLESIRPAVDRAKKLNPSLEGAELIEAAVRENVWQSVFDLYKGSPMIVEMVRSGKVKVVGAVLDISTGRVDWLGEHPWQEAIVGALAARQPEGSAPAPGEFTAQPAMPTEKTASAEPKQH